MAQESTREEEVPKTLPAWALRPRESLETTRAFQRCHHWITDVLFGDKATRRWRQNQTAEYKLEFYRHDNQPSALARSVDLKEPPVGLEQYVYKDSLNPQKIRLLALQPTLNDGAIECNMEIYSLNDLPAYEALSYTWGEEHPVRRIVCNGQSLCVRENLHSALHRLRDSKLVRMLWIDALCINQRNKAERSSQIQHMRVIYHEAERVVVWLGESSVTSSEAFKLLEDIVLASKSETSSAAAKPITSVHLKLHGLPERSSSKWHALGALFWREWFTRIWVIQEASVAKSAIVVCGTNQCSWDDMFAAANYMLKHSLDALTDVDPKRVTKLFGFSSQVNSNRLLFQLLSEARASFATDDRDKIYAILGLASDLHSLPLLQTPDYDLAVSELYTTVAKSFVERDGNLDILSAVEDHRYRLRRGLPSWVPDWEVHVPSSPFSAHPDFVRMRAAGDSKATCKFEHDNKSLVACGQIVDSLNYVGDTFEEFIPIAGNISKGGRIDSALARTRPRQWERMAQKLERYPTGENIESVFVQTLIGRVKLGPEISSDKLPLYYAAWRRYWTVVHRAHGKYIDFSHEELSTEDLARATFIMQAQQQAAYGRRFFTTKNGLMGLSPSLGRINDKIVILLGGKTPYILREVGKGDYRFIGESYVHGLMTGKGLRMNADMQEFRIR